MMHGTTNIKITPGLYYIPPSLRLRHLSHLVTNTLSIPIRVLCLSAIVSQPFPPQNNLQICGSQDFFQRWKHDIRSVTIRALRHVPEFCRYEILIYVNLFSAGPSGRAVCWDWGFESHLEHGCLSVVSVLFCQVDVPATSWSLAQRSPTEWDGSLCVI